jgi:hypothetical protein
MIGDGATITPPQPGRQAGEAAVAEIQGHLKRIYGLDPTHSPDIRPFLVDDAALEELQIQGANRPADEWVLVRESDDGLDLAVWIDGAHLEALGRASGPRDVVRTALRSFCAAVEGVSHFLLLVERAQRAEPVTLLELESPIRCGRSFRCCWIPQSRSGIEHY